VAQREQAIRDATFKATLGAGMDATGQPVMGADGKPAANPVAHAIANYQMAPPSPRSMASPVGQMLMRQVLTENKDYDGTKYPERSKITQDFSASGASGKAITSADTALAHLNTLSQAGQAIKNGDVQLINRLANAVGAHVGQSPQVTYEAILQTVSPEISKAVIGAAGGEADREKMAAGFSSKLSDQQREGAIGATAQLLGARVHKMGQAYESDMGKPLARQLSPESQQVLQRYSGGTGAGGNTGGAAVIPAPVQKALSSASPGIHTLTDGSKWMKASDGTVTAAK
jgi:hypothetical protein